MLNIDACHIKTNEKDTHSIEAMTAIIHQPDSVIKTKKILIIIWLARVRVQHFGLAMIRKNELLVL